MLLAPPSQAKPSAEERLDALAGAPDAIGQAATAAELKGKVFRGKRSADHA